MNLWWEVFGVDDTALGGWIANGARLATVTVAILLTVYKDRFWKPLTVAPDHLAESDDEISKHNRAEASIHNVSRGGLLIWQPAL